jgi:hypothetical protein
MSDLEKQKEKVIKDLKNCLAKNDALLEEYRDFKKVHPNIHIGQFEESEPERPKQG